MPREGRKPISVSEVTAEAVKEGRDAFDDCGSYDDFVRRMLVKLDADFDFLDEDMVAALKNDKGTLEEVEFDA